MGRIMHDATEFITKVDVENSLWVVECPYCKEAFSSGDPMTVKVGRYSKHKWSRYNKWLDTHTKCHEKQIDKMLDKMFGTVDTTDQAIEDIKNLFQPTRIDIHGQNQTR